MSDHDQLACRKLRLERARWIARDLDRELGLVRSGFVLFQPGDSQQEVKALTAMMAFLDQTQVDLMRMEGILDGTVSLSCESGPKR